MEITNRNVADDAGRSEASRQGDRLQPARQGDVPYPASTLQQKLALRKNALS
jgi:hypothetical protein